MEILQSDPKDQQEFDRLLALCGGANLYYFSDMDPAVIEAAKLYNQEKKDQLQFLSYNEYKKIHRSQDFVPTRQLASFLNLDQAQTNYLDSYFFSRNIISSHYEAPDQITYCRGVMRNIKRDSEIICNELIAPKTCVVSASLDYDSQHPSIHIQSSQGSEYKFSMGISNLSPLPSKMSIDGQFSDMYEIEILCENAMEKIDDLNYQTKEWERIVQSVKEKVQKLEDKSHDDWFIIGNR